MIETDILAKEAQGHNFAQNDDDEFFSHLKNHNPAVKFRTQVSSLKKSRQLSVVAEEDPSAMRGKESERGPKYKFDKKSTLPYTCKENLE